MTYPRNCWYVASWSHDVPVGKPVAIQILDESIVLWRTPEGAVNALEDRCPHRPAPLSIGRCEGANLRCMYHGFLFNGEGKTIAIPGQEMIPAGKGPHLSVNRSARLDLDLDGRSRGRRRRPDSGNLWYG